MTSLATPRTAPSHGPAMPLSQTFTSPFMGKHVAEHLARFQSQSAQHEIDQFVVALHEVAQRIEAADPSAQDVLCTLLDSLQNHPDPRCVGLLVFAAALASRLARQSDAAVADEANLYLRGFEVPV